MADMTPEQRAVFDYIADSVRAIGKPYEGKRQTPEEARAAAAEFFSSPGVRAAVSEQVAACEARGHDGYCLVCVQWKGHHG